MKTFHTVWRYMALADDEHPKPYQRITFFYAGSIDYTGSWMGSVLMIPKLHDWRC